MYAIMNNKNIKIGDFNQPWRKFCFAHIVKAAFDSMVKKMKYFFACLIIPIVPILLIAVFGLGALYFGVVSQFERRVQ